MRQRVRDAADGIGVTPERGADGIAQLVVGVIAELRTEHDVPHRVRHPLQSHTSIPTIGTGEILAVAVAERRCRATHKTLRRSADCGIAVAVVPADATIQLQAVFLLVVQVDTRHLSGGQSLAATTPAASTTGREAHVVDIVCTGHHEKFQVVLHPASKNAATITFFRTCRQIGVEHEAFVHTTLDAEVEHRLLLTIIDATYTRQVTLLVVGLHPLNDRGRQILHSRLGVTRHELLTIDHDFLYLLTIDSNLTIVIDLSTRQTLHQLFDHRTLGGAVCRGVIYEGVGLQRYLGSLSGHGGTLQHDGIGLHGQLAHRQVLVGTYRHTLGIRLETHTGNLKDILACSRSLHMETSLQVGQRTSHKRAVRLQQSDTGLCQRFL